MLRFCKSIVVAILTVEARAVVRIYKPHIIVVTGSVGKTSTKDAVYAALATAVFVRKSEKSFNSEVGLPLTILGRESGWHNPLRWLSIIVDGFLLIIFRAPYPKWLVLEVGADRPGDIRRVARWLPVDIAVITRFPEVPAHVEFFKSPAEVIEEKAALISALKPSGTLILYGDDERVVQLHGRAPHSPAVTFGFSEDANVRGEQAHIVYTEGEERRPVGMHGRVVVSGENAEAELRGTIGEHALLPLLAAVAVAGALEVPLHESVRSFEEHYKPAPGRMRLLEGIRHTIVIDDTYNASPAAVEAGLETLEKTDTRGRKIALLGDMLELGRYSVEEHRKMGALAARVCDMLVTVGFRARDAADSALDNGLPDGAIFQYESAEKAGEELEAILQEGDCIFVKGSQSMRMEKAVKQLMAHPEDASKLLVRQEREWVKR